MVKLLSVTSSGDHLCSNQAICVIVSGRVRSKFVFGSGDKFTDFWR